MAKKAKLENMPTIKKSYGFSECKPVNAIIDKGYFDKETGNFLIPEIDVNIPASKIADFVQHALTRALTQDTSGIVSVETIDAEIAVWQAGHPCLPAWRKAKRELSTITASGKPVKAAYGRVEIEGALRDVHGLDDKRVKVVEAFSDEKFKRFMETMKEDQFVIEAITYLNEKAVKAAELQAEKDKAEFEALFGSLSE